MKSRSRRRLLQVLVLAQQLSSHDHQNISRMHQPLLKTTSYLLFRPAETYQSEIGLEARARSDRQRSMGARDWAGPSLSSSRIVCSRRTTIIIRNPYHETRGFGSIPRGQLHLDARGKGSRTSSRFVHNEAAQPSPVCGSSAEDSLRGGTKCWGERPRRGRDSIPPRLVPYRLVSKHEQTRTQKVLM